MQIVDPLEFIQIKYEEDPASFQEGFENFCSELQKLCVSFSSKNREETSFTAGFKFASFIAFTQIDAVIQRSMTLAEEEQKLQEKIRQNLEKLYKM